jgi:hypothetical protein
MTTPNPSVDQPRAKIGTFDKRVQSSPDDSVVLGRKFKRSHAPKSTGVNRWGAIADTFEVAPGIWSVDCEGHGGWKLSAERNAEVAAEWRIDDGWYEEDCEYKIPMYTFCDELEDFRRARTVDGDDTFGREHLEHGLINEHPDAWEAITGAVIQPGESATRDQQLFIAATRDKFVSHAATSRLDGQVRVWVLRASTGERLDLVLPKEHYDNKPIVVDPDVYMRTSDLAEKFLRDQQKCLDPENPDSPTGFFLNKAAAAEHLAAAQRNYGQEMRRLNPDAWANLDHPASKNWHSGMLVDTKTRRANAAK